MNTPPTEPIDQTSTGDPEPISAELETLAGALIDYGLDLLGETAELSVTLAAEDAAGTRALLSFDDDQTEECLEAARTLVSAAAAGKGRVEGLTQRPCRYAIAYDGAIRENPSDPFEPALIVEYGETGMTRGYSAFLFYREAGHPQEFVWTDPAAAGETDLLV